MDFALWSTIIGLLLVVMSLSDSVVARLVRWRTGALSDGSGR